MIDHIEARRYATQRGHDGKCKREIIVHTLHNHAASVGGLLASPIAKPIWNLAFPFALAMGAVMTTLKIINLHHDLAKKRSLVTVHWEDDPEKRLGLVVPFECELKDLQTEAEKAIRALAKELES